MNRFILALITIASITFGVPTWAVDKTFTWTVPTARVDGTELPFEDIASYQLYSVGITSDTLQATIPQPTSTVTSTVTSVSYKLTGIENIGTGVIQFYVKAVDGNGVMSDASNKVSVNVSKPTAPTLSVK